MWWIWLLDEIADVIGPGWILGTLVCGIVLRLVVLGVCELVWQVALHPREVLAVLGGGVIGGVVYAWVDVLYQREVAR